jgi:pSer/pThr/pTyr-binding forkhead associated (FHA) protein
VGRYGCPDVQPTLHQASPAELKARIEAERAGAAFLVLRDDDGVQQIVALDPAAAPIGLGRGSSANVRLAWDREVSRVHAELSCVGGQWALSDDGLSRNGSFVNGERVNSRRRLQDGDQLALGTTKLVFRRPRSPAEESLTTHTSTGDLAAPAVSDAQRRVAVALCRPFGAPGSFAAPATNAEIAEELFLTVAAVKTHLRALFGRFGIEDLPQNEKRLRLVELLLRTGVVGEHELR